MYVRKVIVSCCKLLLRQRKKKNVWITKIIRVVSKFIRIVEMSVLNNIGKVPVVVKGGGETESI